MEDEGLERQLRALLDGLAAIERGVVASGVVSEDEVHQRRARESVADAEAELSRLPDGEPERSLRVMELQVGVLGALHDDAWALVDLLEERGAERMAAAIRARLGLPPRTL